MDGAVQVTVNWLENASIFIFSMGLGDTVERKNMAC